MIRLLASLLPHIIIGLYILGILSFLVSLQQLRRGRTGPYWRIRRAAGQRGGQLFLLSITLVGIASALALFSGLADLAYQRIVESLNSDPNAPRGVVLPTMTPEPLLTVTVAATESSTPTASLTPTRQTDTPEPSPTESPSPTSTFTATSIPSMTPTPTATFENVLSLTPMPSTRQPRAGAKIEIVAAASGISADEQPADSGTVFEAGIHRIYLFMEYVRMDDGVSWSRILFRDGVPIQGQSYLWSLGTDGRSYFFFGSDAGYPAGEYEARLFLGEKQVSRYPFSIRANE